MPTLNDLRATVEAGTTPSPEDWDALSAEWEALSARPTPDALQTLQEAHQTAQAHLEALQTDRDAASSRVAELEASLANHTGQLDQLQAANAEALTKLKTSMALANQVPEALLSGATIAELEASLTGAKTIVTQIADQVRAQAAALVPNANAGRQQPDWSALSPIDKIKQGLAQGNAR